MATVPHPVTASAAFNGTQSFNSAHETDTVGGDEEEEYDEEDPLIGRRLKDYQKEPVFLLIQKVRNEVETLIDSPISYEQYKTPTLNFSVVRPLTVKLSQGIHPPASLIYCLLTNRIQFLSEAEDDLAFSGVNTSRADLCELVALKLLSAYENGVNEVGGDLLHVLTTSFNPFNGVDLGMFDDHEAIDEEALADLKKWGRKEASNALELAIFSKAKRVVKSPLFQQIISAIYTGEVLYQPDGTQHAVLKDDFKQKPVIEVYDWRKRPFLDYSLLKVPMIRTRLEFVSFAAILILFLLAQFTNDLHRITFWEGLFILWTLGFALDEFSSLRENGLDAYLLGLYNVMDAMFCLVFFAFLYLRITGLLEGDSERSQLAFDTLALAGCLLFPRLSISLIRANVVLLALAAMIREFLFFMMLACLTASGFLCAMYILARGSWDMGRLTWLLFKMWLGSTFLGFEVAQEFHPVFGPLLVVSFSILSQTLLLTILISLLSNTFAACQANAETELLNQKALRTIERVKSDALTLYQPPLNLLALLILLPTRLFVTPQKFHSVNVLLTRTFNMPFLLCLALLTRARHNNTSKYEAISHHTTRAWRTLPLAWDGSADRGTVGRIFERALKPKVLEMPKVPGEVGRAGVRRAESVGPTSTRNVTPEGRSPRALPNRLSGHTRMGSLASPLAKIFAVGDEVTQPSSPSTAPARVAEPEATSPVTPDLVARLESIEAALRILVGEVSKNQDEVPPEDRPPLRSLTGQVEESYKD